MSAGEQVVDVPATLSARIRTLGGTPHKTDGHDARSTALAGRHRDDLRPVRLDDLTVQIGLLLARRWQLVSTRQKMLCWVHDQFLQLIPGGAPKVLSPDKVARILRTIPTRSGDPVADQRRQVVVDLLADLRRHHTAIKQVNRQLDAALVEHGTALTGIVGIGRVGAATLISTVGDPTRFATHGKFASFAGVAPLEVSSGDRQRHRVNRGGQRQVNKILHTCDVPGLPRHRRSGLLPPQARPGPDPHGGTALPEATDRQGRVAHHDRRRQQRCRPGRDKRERLNGLRPAAWPAAHPVTPALRFGHSPGPTPPPYAEGSPAARRTTPACQHAKTPLTKRGFGLSCFRARANREIQAARDASGSRGFGCAARALGARTTDGTHAIAVSGSIDAMTEVDVLASGDLTGVELDRLRQLLDDAFDHEFSDDDWDHALGGWHAIVTADHAPVAHAAVVGRQLEVGTRRLTVGYLEATH